MGFKGVLVFAFFASVVYAQSPYKVCVSQALPSSVCQSIGKDDSQVQCLSVESRIDCALKMVQSQSDIGYFSEEETLLIGQRLGNGNRVIATVRDAGKLDPYAFESVAVVRVNHSNGFEGLRGGAYCHPGFDQTDLRWSPRVLKTLEQLSARTNHCPDIETAGKTAEELEVDVLNRFFSAACRPGTWSNNNTVDADLKSRYPNLCSLCGGSCSGYTIDMGVAISGVRNDNHHIQALECLRTNANNGTRPAVAYAAWQHVREYFTLRNPQDATAFGLLCSDGSVIPLTTVNLANSVSPCALVRQPWGTIVARPAVADTLLANLKTWWPAGSDPGGNTWQSIMFTAIAGGANARVFFEDVPLEPLNYTESIRPITSVESSPSCVPTRRWCVMSNDELSKCNWVSTASHILGLQPPITCALRSSIFTCLESIKEDSTDFMATGSNYGYLARQHYNLSPVKLVQNMQADAYRVAAFIRESSAASNITRFENLKGKNVCFPEFGGLAYMSFVRAGHERGILSTSQCDYAKVVSEFFEGGCAPGANDTLHSIDQSGYNASNLCSTCRSAIANNTEPTCAWTQYNKYFGNNGAVSCLADGAGDVAILNMRSMATFLQTQNLQANQLRALCRNNSLAVTPGIAIDNNCLLAYVVDAEVLTRRNDPLFNSLNALFDSIDAHFGYTAASGNQLINLEIFSPLNGISNLLFKDSTIGLTEPTTASSHEPARNYIDLFSHLQTCTHSAAGIASRSVSSILALVVMTIFTKFVLA